MKSSDTTTLFIMALAHGFALKSKFNKNKNEKGLKICRIDNNRSLIIYLS